MREVVDALGVVDYMQDQEFPDAMAALAMTIGAISFRGSEELKEFIKGLRNRYEAMMKP